MMTMIIEQMTRLRLLPSQNSLRVQNVSLRYHLLCAGAGLTEKATKALVHIPTAGLTLLQVGSAAAASYSKDGYSGIVNSKVTWTIKGSLQ